MLAIKFLSLATGYREINKILGGKLMGHISNQFSQLNEQEQLEISGGLGFLAVAGLIVLGGVVAVVANEVVERTTGQDIPSHVGNAINTTGGYLEDLGSRITD
jgi:hypothetical protein